MICTVWHHCWNYYSSLYLLWLPLFSVMFIIWIAPRASNSVLWWSTWAGKMALCCPRGLTRCVPQENGVLFLSNKLFMAKRFRSRCWILASFFFVFFFFFFFWVFMDLDSVLSKIRHLDAWSMTYIDSDPQEFAPTYLGLFRWLFPW